ncbi:type II toxin-antitoxin system RelE family toxin [Zooshikella sp. RANM57]|uniref:type II toxin-antitoxin system RelE family toxin n=1 Tax=Zooshikella sp. RANM57 TaxID=3425863 RepID=UPI003D6E9AA8
MTYQVSYDENIRDDLKAIGHSQAVRVLKEIDKKLKNGQPSAVGEPLRSPLTNCRRIRVGSNRVVYRVNEEEKTVLVIAIGPRDDKAVYAMATPRIT